MPFKWMPAAGNLVTLCADGGGVLVTAGTLDDLTPLAQAYDGRPSTPIRYAATADSVGLLVSMNRLYNGGFELTDMSRWISAGGASVRTTTPGETSGVSAGALKITTTGARTQDISLPSGSPVTFAADLRGDGTSPAYMLVTNLDTGLWLNGTTGAWVGDTSVRVLERVANTYATVSANVTLEPMSKTGRYLTRLRIFVGGPANSFIDTVKARPWFNFVGLMGHNLTGRGQHQDPGTALTKYGQVPWFNIDGTNYTWIVPGGGLVLNGSAYSIPKPNTWNALSAATTGVVTTISVETETYHADFPEVAVGEIVLGYVEDLVPAQLPIGVRWSEAGQIRNETIGGDVYVYNSGPNALRELSLRFIFNTEEHQAAVRDRLYMVSRGGADGVIIVPPDNMVSEVGCIFGLPDQDFSMNLEAPTTGPSWVRTASLVVRELPSPETVEDD